MPKHLPLQTAVWIYDIDEHLIRWANDAALEWWCASSVEEINQRNFEKSTSDAVKQGLLEYKKRFQKGESFCELWEFSPLGEIKKAFCQFSGVLVKDDKGEQRIAMMVEATDADLISPLIESEATSILASFDEQGNLLSCNPPFRTEFGVSYLNIDSILTSQESYSNFFKEFQNSDRFEKDILLKTISGEKWFQATMTPAMQDNGNLWLLVRLHNIDTRKTRELSLHKQARTDSLTGLLNRRGMQECLQAQIKNEQAFHLFYIDLDGFKMINDSLGHGTGDLLLCGVAARLSAMNVEGAEVCRFGGDEFVFAVCRALSEKEANKIAAQIVLLLSEPFKGKQDNLLVISASVGFAVYPTDSDNLSEVIRFADAAMYFSKKLGKKRWTSYQDGMDKALLRKSIVAQYLSVAIENNELALYYQPVMNVKTGVIDSFEALLRWSHPELGNVNPQELIAIAEDIGLIEDVENWVIKTAISELPTLRQYTNSHASIAINISAIHIVNSELPSYLLDELAANKLKPSDLVIEITESVLLDNVEHKNNAIDNITNLGIRLSIDDFGTGYSSLAYLHNIKASIVKIDKAFLSKNSGSKMTLSAIHNLIQSMNMTTLVEGVETQENADLCEQIGIELHQGYFYARPKPLSGYAD